jgi:hypothetical protein
VLLETLAVTYPEKKLLAFRDPKIVTVGKWRCVLAACVSLPYSLRCGSVRIFSFLYTSNTHHNVCATCYRARDEECRYIRAVRVGCMTNIQWSVDFVYGFSIGLYTGKLG